jgi:hypothetical protein
MGKQVKEITEEIISQELFNRDVLADYYDNPDKGYAQLQVHFGFELVDDDAYRRDFVIYQQDTADGYEVWIAHEPNNHIDVGSDVHYYDHSLSDVLMEAMQETHIDTIYVDDIEVQYVEDALTALYDIMKDEIIEDIIETLTEKGFEYNNNK